MYKVKINNMKFHSYIGVYEEEKKIGQNLEIDLVVEMKQKPQNDDISQTLSYSLFYYKVAEIIEKSCVHLVETLATDIIAEIKKIDTQQIGQVKINIRKMNVPVRGIFDSVEIEMEG